MATDEQVDVLIRDEVLRRRIRVLLDEPPKSKWDSISRHPLTALLLGFFLTWFVGTVLTNAYTERRQQEQKRQESLRLDQAQALDRLRAKQAAAALALRQITVLLYERYTTATLLASALKRQASWLELERRKLAYDHAYLQWNAQLQNTLFTVRELTRQKDYSAAEDFIEQSLKPHFSFVDEYLTAGYDARQHRLPWHYEGTVIKPELDACLDACYDLTSTLWQQTNLYEDNPATHLEGATQPKP